MKFTITSITSEGVKAKEDNARGAEPFKDILVTPFQEEKWKFLREWQKAEANRKEYDVSKKEISQSNGIRSFWMLDSQFELLNEGKRIEGNIINNEIVNVSICG